MSNFYPEFTEPARDVDTRLGPMSVAACVAERIEELEAIVEKSIKTEDGVPVNVGDYVYTVTRCGIVWQIVRAADGATALKIGDTCEQFWVPLSTCYSTRAAAEAAKEGATKCST